MLTTIAVVIIGLVVCQVEGVQIEAVRLVGGSNNREGRLEVLSGGTWGTVCGNRIDRFDLADAAVVCRSLGLPIAPAIVVRSHVFGEGTGPIGLVNVRCTGTEATLNECSQDINGRRGCPHLEDIGVVCGARSITGIRLVNGPSSQHGRLEVQLSGRWGTVCDDGFTSTDAQVACRQLGFATANAQVYDLKYGNGGQGAIHLDDVNCTGSEANLDECLSEYRDNCSHNEDVGVICA